MDFVRDIQLHVGFGALVCATLLAVRHPSLRRFEVSASLFAAGVGLAAFFNFGSLHHYSDRGFVNRWELFHYHLGSKYFPELGYDGLYAASLLAQRETAPEIRVGGRIRDLSTNRLERIADHAEHVWLKRFFDYGHDYIP